LHQIPGNLEEPRRSPVHLVVSGVWFMKKNTSVFLIILASAAAAVAVWALLHFTAPKRHGQSTNNISSSASNTNADQWARAIEKVKEDRGEAANGQGGINVPPELRHYEDRHWFLATQVAEVKRHNIQSSQDFVDLAAMIERGEMVSVPAATDTYVLFGVGAKADNDVFSRYANDQSIGLYNEAELREAYARIDAARANVQTAIAKLNGQLGALRKRDRAKQKELQKQVTARQQELKSTDEQKALLDQFYGQLDSRQRLFRDYESLRSLARNFGGRTYDIDNASDRQAMKLSLLRSLRPEAFKVLEEIATDYHRTFDRPLPISSLVRPEQYQHALSKVNRNAVIIDTPPHSTGLAFDIDYRYMSAAEQSFLMTELARMKNQGRIEALRERNANYHVFAFVDGVRPNDELIRASLDEVSAPIKETHHLTKKAAKARGKSQKAKNRNTKVKKRRR
jgi:multidrug efflux pump subunit AcrA (membrane-fusion protein)